MKAKELTILAMLIAITVILGVVPNLGIIQIGAISLTILHIPVIVAAELLGIKGGAIVGLTFGVASWFVAVTRAVAPLDLLFTNPLISILPRFLFGLITGLLCQLFRIKKKWQFSIIGFVSTLIHTFLVYFALYIVAKDTIVTLMNVTDLLPFLLSAISANAILEAALGGVVAYFLIDSIDQIKQ